MGGLFKHIWDQIISALVEFHPDDLVVLAGCVVAGGLWLASAFIK